VALTILSEHRGAVEVGAAGAEVAVDTKDAAVVVIRDEEGATTSTMRVAGTRLSPPTMMRSLPRTTRHLEAASSEKAVARKEKRSR